MTEKQKEIVERISEIIHRMTEQQGEQFLAFGEGMAYMANQTVQRPGA